MVACAQSGDSSRCNNDLTQLLDEIQDRPVLYLVSVSIRG